MSFNYSFSEADYEKFKNGLFPKKTNTAPQTGGSPSVFPAADGEISKEGDLTDPVLPYSDSDISSIEYTNGEKGFKNVKTIYKD